MRPNKIVKTVKTIKTDKTFTKVLGDDAGIKAKTARAILVSLLRYAHWCGMTEGQEQLIDTKENQDTIENILFKDLPCEITVKWSTSTTGEDRTECWNRLLDGLLDSHYAGSRQGKAEAFFFEVFLRTLGKRRPVTEAETRSLVAVGFREEDAKNAEVLAEQECIILYRVPQPDYSHDDDRWIDLNTINPFPDGRDFYAIRCVNGRLATIDSAKRAAEQWRKERRKQDGKPEYYL